MLYLPAFIPFALHYYLPPANTFPTGFIQSDMPYYMVCARKHFDDGGFSLTYGTPFSPNYDTPKNYFQPQTLLLGLILGITKADPAIVFILFGVVSSTICIRIALAIFEWLIGLASAAQWLAAVCFIWGGGLLVALGGLKWLSSGSIDDLFYFDPGGGFWFLNLGRNYVYPTEGYYHALFLGCVYFLLKERYWPAVGCMAVLSFSHPFTGVELILIVLAWAALERLWIDNRKIRWPHLAALVTLLAIHLGYYLVLLNISPEHREIQKQWTKALTYEAQHFVPGYALVAALAFWAIRRPKWAAEYFSQPDHRLFAVWAMVAFALANHEFAIQPSIQPVHFARGYVWTPLFLMGAPALTAAFQWLLAARRRVLGLAPVALMVGTLLLDNVAFIATYHWRSKPVTEELYVPKSFWNLTATLNHPEHRGALLLTPVQIEHLTPHHVSYLLSVYTPLRSWISHHSITPFSAQRNAEMRDLLLKGAYLPEWRQRTVLMVAPPWFQPAWLSQLNAKPVYNDETFVVYRIEPSR